MGTPADQVQTDTDTLLLQLLERELDRPDTSSCPYQADLIAWVQMCFSFKSTGNLNNLQVQASTKLLHTYIVVQ